jgi:hypothetical protein
VNRAFICFAEFLENSDSILALHAMSRCPTMPERWTHRDRCGERVPREEPQKNEQPGGRQQAGRSAWGSCPASCQGGGMSLRLWKPLVLRDAAPRGRRPRFAKQEGDS